MLYSSLLIIGFGFIATVSTVWIASNYSSSTLCAKAAAGFYENNIYIIGGSDECNKSIIQYNIIHKHFKVIDVNGLSDATWGNGQFYHQMDNILYLIEPKGKRIFIYDLKNNQFINNYNNITLPQASETPSLIVTNKYLFAIGYSDTDKTTYRLHLIDNTWITLSLNTARRQPACVIHPRTNIIYAISGFNTKTIETLSTNNEPHTWSTYSAEVDNDMINSRALYYNDVIYIIGGYIRNQYINTVYQLNTINHQISHSTLPYEFAGTAAVCVNNILYAFGGGNGMHQSTNSWIYSIVDSASPTNEPSNPPTKETNDPTASPTDSTRDPTSNPTIAPTLDPTFDPTFTHSLLPSHYPTKGPNVDSTKKPDLTVNVQQTRITIDISIYNSTLTKQNIGKTLNGSINTLLRNASVETEYGNLFENGTMTVTILVINMEHAFNVTVFRNDIQQELDTKYGDGNVVIINIYITIVRDSIDNDEDVSQRKNNSLSAIIGASCSGSLCIILCIIVFYFKKISKLKLKYQTLITNPMVLFIAIGDYDDDEVAIDADFDGYVRDLRVDIDIKNLLTLFRDRLQYQTFPEYNDEDPKIHWKQEELINFLKEKAQIFENNLHDTDNDTYDGLLIVISSHGMNSNILMSDYKLISKDVIHRMFSSYHPKSRTVPRVIIYDCCEGIEEMDMSVRRNTTEAKTGKMYGVDRISVVMLNDDDSESPQPQPLWESNTKNPDHKLVTIHAANTGFQSKMNCIDGSYLIHKFVNRSLSALETTDVKDQPFLYEIFDEIQNELGERKQLPVCTYNNNTRYIKFVPHSVNIS